MNEWMLIVVTRGRDTTDPSLSLAPQQVHNENPEDDEDDYDLDGDPWGKIASTVLRVRRKWKRLENAAERIEEWFLADLDIRNGLAVNPWFTVAVELFDSEAQANASRNDRRAVDEVIHDERYPDTEWIEQMLSHVVD